MIKMRTGLIILTAALIIRDGNANKILKDQSIVEDNSIAVHPSAPQIPVLTEVIGVNKPAGPLSSAFQDTHRFPGFPFEFPPIVPGSDKKYLIFPGDSAANYLSSAKRCGAMGGKLVRLETPVEMEILACAITSPVFIASWMGNDFGGPINGACPVLFPGGVISSTIVSINFC
jgi:hypothetical protein